MSRINTILEQVGEIKPLPGTVLRLIGVINDPASTVNDIVETIKYDQAMTSQLLRICNSAYFGLSREIHSLSEAIRYLGTMKIMQLIMAVHTNALLSKGQRGYDLAPGSLWKHSVGCAIAAAAVAQRISLENAGVAFTSGLLHDLGKVILSEHVADEFTRIVELVMKEKKSFTEAEQQVLGFSHCEVGARVAEAWQIPEPIIQAIRHHHTPTALDPPNPLVDTVYLANCTCLLFGVGLGADGLATHADPVLMERHGLVEADLEFIGAQMITELKKVEHTFAEGTKTQVRAVSGA